MQSSGLVGLLSPGIVLLCRKFAQHVPDTPAESDSRVT